MPLPDLDYNIAPTTFQPIIRNNRDTGRREMEAFEVSKDISNVRNNDPQLLKT